MKLELAEQLILQVKDEWQQNLRFRVGVWFSIVLFLTWMSLVWSDVNRELFEQQRALNRNLQSLAQIEPAEVWQGRIEKLAEQNQRQLQDLWEANSDGLAQAKVQAALTELVLNDDNINKTIKAGVPQPLDELEDVRQLRVRVATSLTSTQLRDTLKQIEGHPKLLVIDRIDLRRNGLRWNVELVISAFYLKEAS